MITKEQAMALKHRDELWKVSHHIRCRVNGKCKTWKRSPEKFRLPVKYGLYDCFYITEVNADEWEVRKD